MPTFSNPSNLASFENLYKSLREYNNFINYFIDSFKEKATKYKADCDFTNKDEVLRWVGNLIGKMETDNKWLIEQISQKDNLIERMKGSENEYKIMWQKSEKRSNEIIDSVKDTIKYTVQQRDEKEKIKETLQMHMNSIINSEIMVDGPI